MKHYIGTKQVEAELMSKGEAYEKGLLKAGIVPSEEESSIMGYHVRYKDGYESWSPKDVFEKAYQVAETPLDRMEIEWRGLSDRITKLSLFIGSNKFMKLDTDIQAMLKVQYQIMMEYNDILCARMQRMGGHDCSVFPFSIAIRSLKVGYAIRRTGWSEKGLFVYKQVPAHITSEIIPQATKDCVPDDKSVVDCTPQYLIYNENTNCANSWVPSISDVLADDWELAI